jgi:hypothetical protein
MRLILISIAILVTGCTQTSTDAMTEKQIKIMNTMRNPICRQVGSYLYCNEM